jgi:hypothetical protein
MIPDDVKLRNVPQVAQDLDERQPRGVNGSTRGEVVSRLLCHDTPPGSPVNANFS